MKEPKPTKTDCFIAGLTLVRRLVKGASFYNSSGDTAFFDLTHEPSEPVIQTLKSLGWEYSRPDRAWTPGGFPSQGPSISFTEYGDWQKEPAP